jgi:hypothetical protein
VATAGGNNDDGRHPKWLVPSVCPLGYPRRRPEASHVGIPYPDPSSDGRILGCNPGESVTERGARKGGGDGKGGEKWERRGQPQGGEVGGKERRLHGGALRCMQLSQGRAPSQAFGH